MSNISMTQDQRIIVDDLVNYHFSGEEQLLAQAIIEEDEDFAEKLLEELRMQLLLKEKDNGSDKDIT